mmetsp:Transcript_782/g.1642  ORF Transcript_782/g.1642 Transcript_782/m.1642 type:complete len:188 (-) Transcript_782:306-869(-)
MKLHTTSLACFLALIAVSDAQPPPPEDQNDGPADDICPPVDEIVDGEPCGQFIPSNSQEASCFTSVTEQCNCPGQEDPDPVWVCRNIEGDIGFDEVTEFPSESPSNATEPDELVPPEPEQNCRGASCDPNQENQCTCRPNLQCRQRQVGVYQCSQAPRTERNRLSSSESIGGAAGRDRRNRLGLVSF